MISFSLCSWWRREEASTNRYMKVWSTESSSIKTDWSNNTRHTAHLLSSLLSSAVVQVQSRRFNSSTGLQSLLSPWSGWWRALIGWWSLSPRTVSVRSTHTAAAQPLAETHMVWFVYVIVKALRSDHQCVFSACCTLSCSIQPTYLRCSSLRKRTGFSLSHTPISSIQTARISGTLSR